MNKKSIYQLAKDINKAQQAYDPYGYDDAFNDPEEGFNNVFDTLVTDPQAVADWINEILSDEEQMLQDYPDDAQYYRDCINIYSSLLDRVNDLIASGVQDESIGGNKMFSIDLIPKPSKKEINKGNKKLKESYDHTIRYIRNIGDMLDGFIDNMSDEQIDKELRLFKRIGSFLGQKNYDNVVFYKDNNYDNTYDPDAFSELVDHTESDKLGFDKVYLKNGDILAAEYNPNGGLFLYFKDEDSCNDYLDACDEILSRDYESIKTEKVVQKKNGKWTNRNKKGEEFGEFDTRDQAVKQCRAMYAGESLELKTESKEVTEGIMSGMWCPVCHGKSVYPTLLVIDDDTLDKTNRYVGTVCDCYGCEERFYIGSDGELKPLADGMRTKRYDESKKKVKTESLSDKLDKDTQYVELWGDQVVNQFKSMIDVGRRNFLSRRNPNAVYGAIKKVIRNDDGTVSFEDDFDYESEPPYNPGPYEELELKTELSGNSIYQKYCDKLDDLMKEYSDKDKDEKFDLKVKSLLHKYLDELDSDGVRKVKTEATNKYFNIKPRSESLELRTEDANEKEKNTRCFLGKKSKSEESLELRTEDVSPREKIVIYKSLGDYYTTPESNYGKRISNARAEHKMTDFNSADEVMDYYIKYGWADSRDDFIVIDESKKSIKEDLTDVEFNDKYFPRVDIKNKAKYDYYKYRGKDFAYDKDDSLVLYLFKDTDEEGPDAPWREIDSVGLSYENWKDKESRDGYLDGYCDNLDEEAQYEIDNFLKYEYKPESIVKEDLEFKVSETQTNKIDTDVEVGDMVTTKVDHVGEDSTEMITRVDQKIVYPTETKVDDDIPQSAPEVEDDTLGKVDEPEAEDKDGTEVVTNIYSLYGTVSTTLPSDEVKPLDTEK